MVVQHNLSAMNTNRQFNIVNRDGKKSTEKLSSGYRINRAADDAAGLAISEKMRRQIRGLDQASRNVMDGISVCQIAEGALNETHDILHRMNELAIQAANGTNTSLDKAAVKDEIDQLAMEIDSISQKTEFNSMKLLDGSFVKKNLQISDRNEKEMELNFKVMDAHALGFTIPFDDANYAAIDEIAFRTPYSTKYLNPDDETTIVYEGWNVYNALDPTKKLSYDKEMEKHLKVDTNENANRTMRLVQNAVNVVSEFRSEIGAIQNRLEHTKKINDNTSENTQYSESQIRDTNMAKEMVQYSNQNILQQAGQAMLAQANQSNQGVLSILQ